MSNKFKKFNKRLYEAVGRGDLSEATDALEKGASANYVCSETETYSASETPVLYVAVKNKNIELVNLLLNNGADANARCYERAMSETDDTTCLIAALPSIEIMRALLEKGADTNATLITKWDHLRETTIFELAGDNTEVLDLLKQYPKVRNNFEYSPPTSLEQWKCRCGCMNPVDREMCFGCDRYRGE